MSLPVITAAGTWGPVPPTLSRLRLRVDLHRDLYAHMPSCSTTSRIPWSGHLGTFARYGAQLFRAGRGAILIALTQVA